MTLWTRNAKGTDCVLGSRAQEGLEPLRFLDDQAPKSSLDAMHFLKALDGVNHGRNLSEA